MERRVPETLLTGAMWIDIHAHLDRLPEAELARVIAEAAEAGVGVILSASTDLTSAAEVVRRIESFPALYGAVGISPFDAPGSPDDWEGRLRALLKRERVIAVGEIGLDRSNPRYPPAGRQLPYFEKQVAIAADAGLPAVIHSRGAEREAAGICRSLGVEKALFHCFTGSREALGVVLDNGYYVSFSGIITWNADVAALAADVPSDRLFIETDAPYLAPAPHRGTVNRPSRAAIVGETAARLRGVQPGELQAAIAANFERLFSRHPAGGAQ
jgi:TatD DNase family protein